MCRVCLPMCMFKDNACWYLIGCHHLAPPSVWLLCSWVVTHVVSWALLITDPWNRVWISAQRADNAKQPRQVSLRSMERKLMWRSVSFWWWWWPWWLWRNECKCQAGISEQQCGYPQEASEQEHDADCESAARSKSNGRNPKRARSWKFWGGSGVLNSSDVFLLP